MAPVFSEAPRGRLPWRYRDLSLVLRYLTVRLSLPIRSLRTSPVRKPPLYFHNHYGGPHESVRLAPCLCLLLLPGCN